MSQHRITLAAVTVAIASLPRIASAQDARLVAIRDADVRASIGAMIVDAERHGLPREPLVTKALQGVEMGAPAPKIEAAVRAMVVRLATARTLVSPVATPTELKAVEDALYAGVPADAVRPVSQAAGGRPTPVAVGVLALLVTRGVPSTTASRAVTLLVKRGAKDQQLLALQRGVQEDLAAGVSPSTALEIRQRNLIATLPPPVQGPTATFTPKP